MSSANYVLVTAAKNEQDYLEKTLESVIAQTILPTRWVIVSDGSTDHTDQIARRYAGRYDFIRFVRTESGAHNFNAKVYAFRRGYSDLQDTAYDFIGSLDADIALPPDYYERLLTRFAADKTLGLTGGARMDRVGDRFVKVRFNALNFGAGYQFFRRACYEQIGGYLPLELGGEDTVAGIMARYHGWRVRAFPDLVVYHWRPTGSAQGHMARIRFRIGQKCFLMGYHPLFQCAKLVRLSRPADLFHNLCEMAGYLTAALHRRERQVPDVIVSYLRAEQLRRLRTVVSRLDDPTAGRRDRSPAV
jgi:glycosyltransferase involved in cell wall biosynthesis